MLGKAYTSVINGISAVRVKVEADVSAGFPSFDMTGNLGVAAREAKGRVRMAVKNSGFRLEPAKTVINIAPANLRKEGTHYDLAIAIALLGADGRIDTDVCEDILFIGELGLDGEVRPVKGVLPMVIDGRGRGMRRFVLPSANVSEAAYVKNVQVIGVNTLIETVEYINGIKDIMPARHKSPDSKSVKWDKDFSDIHGQTAVKRAVMVASASMHNLLMIGPPGAGKTMTAERIPAILPPLDYEQQLELSQIYSVAGLLKDGVSFMDRRPFRAPHHSITPQTMAGGGANPTPGEISLACHGVLFMDEFNLFSVQTIETLRQPLECGRIAIDRLSKRLEYPADFMLVAAMNPCKCGYYPDRTKCRCMPSDIRAYFGKLSRPVVDRIDICVQAPKIKYADMEKDGDDIYSDRYMKRKITDAVNIQRDRFKGCDYNFNSKIPSHDIGRYCRTDKGGKDLLKNVFDKFDLSARSYHKLLKVARTIADIEGSGLIREEHISEAVSYRLV